MKWASRLLQHQLVEPDGPMEVAGDAATAPWEFEYTVSSSLASVCLFADAADRQRRLLAPPWSDSHNPQVLSHFVITSSLLWIQTDRELTNAF